MSQTEHLPLRWSETVKIHLKSPWMLWCCAQFNINLPRSIPNPYLHVLHYALCFGRAHSRHSGDLSQLPVILVQDWFRWKILKQIGCLNICWPWNSSPTEIFLGASGRDSLRVVDIYNFELRPNESQKWMSPSWASIKYAWSFPNIFLLFPSLLNFLLIKNRKSDVICMSEIWDSDLFHSPVWITVMFRKDSPLSTTICCVGLWSFKKSSRSGGMIQVAIILVQNSLHWNLSHHFDLFLFCFLFPVHHQKIVARPYLMLQIHFSIKSYISS